MSTEDTGQVLRVGIDHVCDECLHIIDTDMEPYLTYHTVTAGIELYICDDCSRQIDIVADYINARTRAIPLKGEQND